MRKPLANKDFGSQPIIDREYPHQVIVLAEKVQGRNLHAVIVFHEQIGQPMRYRSVIKDDLWHAIYCFADRTHASAFQALFGGEMKEAANRGGLLYLGLFLFFLVDHFYNSLAFLFVVGSCQHSTKVLLVFALDEFIHGAPCNAHPR